MKKIFYDLETTGLDFKKHAIHQISGIIEIDGEIKEDFNFKIKPHEGSFINKDAIDICKITVEDLKKYPEAKEVYRSLISILEKYVKIFDKKDKFFLVGYNNTSFDNQFLREWFLKNEDRYFGSWFWSNSIDVMILASEFLQDKRLSMTDFKLKTVAQFLDIRVDENKLHDANYDIYLTREIYKIITQK